MNAKKYIVIILVIVCCICIYIYILSNRNKFNKDNVIFEFYAQELFIHTNNNNEEIRIACYIGIDKYRNLYVREGKKSNALYDLWVYNEKRKNSLYVGEENMTLNDYIPNPEYEVQVKVSEEEYMEIISLMDEVVEDWKKDDGSKNAIFEHYISGNAYLHFFKYNDKYYEFSSLIYSQELGSAYEKWGEIATNNIIKVRGIVDRYIDNSFDPKQFNYSEWNFYVDSLKYKNKFNVPKELMK